MWASGYVKIGHEYPHLYEDTSENTAWVLPVRKLCASVSDYCSYFLGTSERDDVERVQKCASIFKEYEQKCLKSLLHGIDTSLQTYKSSEDDVPKGPFTLTHATAI